MKPVLRIGVLIMLTALTASLVPGAALRARALTACDAAQFVADITIPDGTFIKPGGTFVKTWRLKNIGTCRWNTAYSLVFSSGTQMGGNTSVLFPRFVSPGQTVDLSVTLVAPTAPGTYKGFWLLQNDSGGIFGIGAAHASPFWVSIRIQGAVQNGVAYDFVAEMCSAQWIYDGGPIPCPMNTNKLQFGHVEKLDNPVLETGRAAGFPGLLTIPQQKYNGVIRGMFPVDDIFRGDHFQATVGCQFGATNCYVTYALEYELGGDFFTLWKWREKYDGLTAPVDVDLTRLANFKNLRLVLSVFASGPAAPDQPLWIAPRIVRGIAVPISTLTPIPPTPVTPSTSVAPTDTPVPTTTAGPDKAQFISDVTVPDGTTFAPNTPFTKVWRLKNVGTTTWTTAYSLAFVSGDRMGGVETLLPQTVAPGQTVDVGLNLTAPTPVGSYRGYWELRNASGAFFGISATFDKPVWVAINVLGLPAPTVAASRTPTPTARTATPGTATRTATPTSTPTAAPTATATATTSATSNWSTYLDVKYGFAFKIPPGSTIASQSDNSGRVYLPITPGTNLVNKYLDVSVAEGVTTCKSPVSNPNNPPENVTFNGIQFLKETWVEGATSHMGEYTAYSTAKGTTCITMTFLLWSVVPGVMATPPPVFDHAAESAVFTTIMSSYTNQ